MRRISFVLLYYKALNDTIECISSLLKLEEFNCAISMVIVDNCSGDGTFEQLKKKYEDEKKIYFISVKENLGYARGNNIGIKYSKETLGADFVVVLNTDTVIEQKNFCNIILSEYEKEHFYVMGPKVTGYYDRLLQSPIQLHEANNSKKIWLSNSVHWLMWKTYLINIMRVFRKAKHENKAQPKENEKYTCICHGCCLIFSPIFLKRWDGFYNNTFLYREEAILFYILHTLGCKTIYSDKLEVYHKGGASAEAEYGKSERAKKLPFYKINNQSVLEEIKVRKMSRNELEESLK